MKELAVFSHAVWLYERMRSRRIAIRVYEGECKGRQPMKKYIDPLNDLNIKKIGLGAGQTRKMVHDRN